MSNKINVTSNKHKWYTHPSLDPYLMVAKVDSMSMYHYWKTQYIDGLE